MARKNKWIKAAPDHLLEDVAATALEIRLDAVWHYLPLAAHGSPTEIENVHQLRVSTRRAMAAMHIFDSLLSPRRAEWMNRQLKRVRRAAGDARDLDVFALRLARLSQAEPNGTYRVLLEWIEARRAEAQGPIEKICNKLERKDFPRREIGLIRRVRLRDPEHKAQRPTFLEAARASLGPLVDEFFAAGSVDMSDLEALHAFRIQGKQLRYAMEVFAGAFPPVFRRELYRTVEKLQEMLGQVNDHATAQDHLRSWLDRFQDRRVAEVLLAQIELEKQALEESRARFVNWWTADRIAQLRQGFAAVLAAEESDEAS